jgi:dTDP-4-dehydrorhamnose reductase
LIARLGADPFGVCQELRGVYHLAGSGSTSRYELARSALELDPKRAEHVVEKLVPIPSSDLVRPARRPAHAPLDCSRIAERFGVRMPDWRSGLERALGGE